MRYTTPPGVNAAAAQSSITAKLTKLGDDITQLYTNDEAILSMVQTRKERRKQGGLIKFSHGSIDLRKVAVEEPWNGMKHNNDEESDGDDDDENDVGGMDVDPEVDDEESDEEGKEEASDAETGDSKNAEHPSQDEAENEAEVELPHRSRKQKRKRVLEKSVHPPPAKKVAFSPMPPKLDRSKIQGSKNTKSKLSAIAKTGKVANVMVKTKSKGHPDLGLAGKSKDESASEPEAYDFGKFFK